MRHEAETEKMIRDKGLNAPRLTPEQIEASIVGKQFYRFPGTVVTVCCLTLRNGFNTVGESAPVSEENFDQEVGEKVAFERARQKIWELEGYLLKDTLHAQAGLQEDQKANLPPA